MLLLILPHQLYRTTYLNGHINRMKDTIVLWEHPQYFTAYNFNKKKLILHRSSMKYYYDMLKTKKYNVEYVEFQDTFPYDEYIMFDPIDDNVMIRKITKQASNIICSPNFILTKEQYKIYRDKTESIIFNNFYLFFKKEINLYPELKSLDKMNRTKYNKNIKIDTTMPHISKTDTKYITEACIYITKYFPNNCGNIDNMIYPVTHTTAKKWFTNFINTKLKNFGSYEDLVIYNYTDNNNTDNNNTTNSFMYHSVLSSSINIGLLNPNEIIEVLKKVKDTIPLNSFEGYLRQLFWREYQRYTYIYVDFDKNYFGNTKKLNKDWYDGTLGIPPIDKMIIDGFDKGYIHHIGRLMFIGNFMNLSGIAPLQGFKWFMEFSIDSYEWVMKQNVLDMVFFVTGGLTMRRPYISSSNYILQMSNIIKGKWVEEWDELYYRFIKLHHKKLWKFRYYIKL